MTDLDTDLLRRALRASPGPEGRPERGPEPALDPAPIITRGRRLRWRRRAVAAGGGVCLAAAVFGVITGVGRLTVPSPGPGHHTVVPVGPAGPAGTSTRPRPVPSPVRDGAEPSPSASDSPTAIPTGRASSSTPASATPPTNAPATPSPTATASAAGLTPSASASSVSPSSADPGTTATGATSAAMDRASATPTATQ